MAKRGFLRRMFPAADEWISWFLHSWSAITVFLVVLFILPVYVFYKAVILPVTTCGCDFPPVDSLRAQMPVMDPDSNPVSFELARQIGSLEMTSAWLGCQLNLSRQDSAYLNLDLAANMLTLMIKGVPVRSCTLHAVRTSRQIKCLDRAQLVHWITVPFMSQKAFSTIPKIRYVNKKAPKDTIEAALMGSAPMPADTSSVCFTIYFDRHLVLQVEQAEEPFDTEREVIKKYRSECRQAVRKSTMRALFHHSNPESGILIRITMSKADARAVYRGLPVRTGLSLKLPERPYR